MNVTYTFSIINDFPNHLVSLDKLTLEIRLSSIKIALDYITTSGDDCNIFFKDALNLDDQAILQNIIATHSGVNEGPAFASSLSASNESVEVRIQETETNIGVQLLGSWVGSLGFQGTINGNDWFSIDAYEIGKNVPVISTSNNGQWNVAASGLNKFRIFATSILSGSVTVAFNSTTNTSVVRVINPLNDDGVPSTTVEPRTGTELILVTHNYCDPTTWYGDSVRVNDEVLIDSGDGLTFNSANVNWIDLIHGKLFDEDSLASDVEHGYRVEVTVDGVPMTYRDPFSEVGGDYSINHVSGTITFFTNQTGKNVSASYSHATTSTWYMIPDPGTRIDIETCETQFSANVILRDTIQFDIYAYNPNDLPNKFMFARTSYKTMRNFVDEAQGSYPVIPPIGGNEGRGMSAIYGFPFRYGTIRKIFSSQGIELRVHLKNDIPYGGDHATATFYCTVREEE